MPDGNWSVRETKLNPSGWTTSVSELEKLEIPAQGTEIDFSPSHATVMSNHDIFGRARTIKTPDGKSTTVVFAGVREAKRTRKVATSSTSETDVSTTEEYDRQGRLWKVTENSGSTNDKVVTTYTYDAGDHLTSVSTSGHGYEQPSRTFTYDGRGFVTSETHPESGTTTYTYDARGNITRRQTPTSDVTSEYDKAGRLKKVTDGDVGVLKELHYDRPNTGSDFSNGKLDWAERHNWQPYLGDGDVVIRETYRYTGVGGRLATKETTASTGEAFTDSYAYSTLGLPSSVTLPRCTSCSGLSQTLRTISNGYKHGLLSQVTGYAGPIEYHPNGMLKSVRHLNADGTNGPLYEQTIDSATQMARPAAINVRNSCASFKVVQQPANRTIASGDPAGLTVTAPGATSFMWYQRKTTGSDSLILGQDTNTLTIVPTTTSTYWARASNGTCSVDTATAIVTVQSCPSPAPHISAAATMAASSVATATATVASGTSVTYSWALESGNTNATFTSATNGASVSFRAKCSGTIVLKLTVTSACTSETVLHEIDILPVNASLAAQATTVNQGSSATLTATIGGTGPWSVTWSDNAGAVTGVPSPVTRVTGPLLVKTTYTATATDAYGCSDASNAVTIMVKPPAPTNVVAVAQTATSVTVTWSFSGTADSFEILRQDRAPGSPSGYRVVGTSTTNTFTNVSIPAGTAYLYRVRAIVTGTASADSVPDLATTVMFTAGTTGDVIAGQDIMQLRTAVNAVRTLANLTATAFTNR